MKLQLDEQTLNAYINQAINEEINEFLGLSRDEKNAKWGYQWNDKLSDEQNKRLRDLNRANIRAAGYKNAAEYEAGEGHRYGAAPEQEQEIQQIPNEYPYKNDKQKTGQFQTWFNLPVAQGGMGGNLVVDGIWGPKTEAAYQQWLSAQNKQ